MAEPGSVEYCHSCGTGQRTELRYSMDQITVVCAVCGAVVDTIQTWDWHEY